MLELLDDRITGKATLITSQLPVEHWYAYLNDPTLADAILDRIVHGSHRLTLKGESLRNPVQDFCRTPSGSLFRSAPTILPSHIVGVISLVVLAISIFALYARHLAGPWRRIYVVGAVMALYLNTFVGVVQPFLKVPPLDALAPTQSDRPFLITQIIVLGILGVLGIMAVRSFHPRRDSTLESRLKSRHSVRKRESGRDATH